MKTGDHVSRGSIMVAIFCPFGLFCEIDISLLSLQTQPDTAPKSISEGPAITFLGSILGQDRVPYEVWHPDSFLGSIIGEDQNPAECSS